MNVQQLFEDLSYGELANLAIGMDGSGTILESMQPRVVSFANRALGRIYTRLINRTNFVTVRLFPDVNLYKISSNYAVSNTAPNHSAPLHIIDTVEEPYTDDLIRVLLMDQIETLEEPIDAEPLDVRMVGYDTLLVRNPREGVDLRIEYQAKHVPLVIPVDPSQEIVLHPSLEEALNVRVASLIYGSMDGEASLARAQMLNNQFEEILTTTRLDGFVTEAPLTDRAKLGKGGWV